MGTSRRILTTTLDVIGLVLLVAAAAIIWWPSALAVAGFALLAVSWRQS